MAKGIAKPKGKAKKGQRKKEKDAFLKKEWYNVHAPHAFKEPQFGQTLVNRTQGTKISSDNLNGRVFEVNLGDLNLDEEHAFRKLKFRADAVEGTEIYTNYHAVDLTTDKVKSLIRKWQTLIECFVEGRTTDQYLVRVFVIAFTKRMSGQVRKTSYAQTSQVKLIRKKMCAIIEREIAENDLRNLVAKICSDVISKDIERSCRQIYPLQHIFVRKLKTLKRPKFQKEKLMELYKDDKAEDLGQVVETQAVEEQVEKE